MYFTEFLEELAYVRRKRNKKRVGKRKVYIYKYLMVWRQDSDNDHDNGFSVFYCRCTFRWIQCNVIYL